MPWEFWRSEEFDYIIRHFFPQLKLLIFLIDDSEADFPRRHAATSLTNIRTLFLNPKQRGDLPAFVGNTTGPFEEIVLNKEFESEILEQASRYLRKSTDFGSWRMGIDDNVQIVVRGCALLPPPPREMDRVEIDESQNSKRETPVGGKGKMAVTTCCALM